MKYILTLFFTGIIFWSSAWGQRADTTKSKPLKSINLSQIEILGSIGKQQAYRTEQVGILAIQKSNAANLGDFLRAIPNLGGVRKGASGIDPVLRGLKYSQINVQVDGAKIEGGCPSRMDPATSHVDINQLSKIKVIKGPYALKYGVNFGGVIELQKLSALFHPHSENHIQLLYGTQSNYLGSKLGININGGNQKLAYTFSANKKAYGDYKDGAGRMVSAAYQHMNVSGQIAFKPAPHQTFTVDADRSKGLNIDFPSLPMDERLDNTQLYHLRYKADSISKTIHHVELMGYYSYVGHLMDNKNRPFSDTVVSISDILAKTYGARGNSRLTGFGKKWEVGFDFQHINKTGTRDKHLIKQVGLPVVSEMLWKNARYDNLGFYLVCHQQIKVFDWVLSARIDFNRANSDPLEKKFPGGAYSQSNTYSQFTNFSFSSGLSWAITPTQMLHLSLGRGSRSPDLTERFIILMPVGLDPYDYLGNPDLKPENNLETDLGYSLQKVGFGRLNASVFYSYLTQFISSELVAPAILKPATPGVLGVKRFINLPKAFLTGVELAYYSPTEKPWHLYFQAAYTMGWNPNAVKPLFENGQLIGEQKIKNDPLPEIPPFETHIGFRYEFFAGRLSPELNIRMVSAQHRISTAYYEQTSPGFTLFNVKIAYRYNQYLRLYTGINNLLNKAYFEHLNRVVKSNRLPIYEPGRLFYINLIINL
jgi:iron complex outermembrane receptor protein